MNDPRDRAHSQLAHLLDNALAMADRLDLPLVAIYVEQALSALSKPQGDRFPGDPSNTH